MLSDVLSLPSTSRCRIASIDHLIRMQSGLHEYHDRSGDFEPMDRAEALRRIMEQPLRFKPGTSQEYSNSGFAVLAAIIEEVSGATYTDYVDSVFFKPAGLSRTGYYQDARWDDSSTACGYDAREFGDVNSPQYWPPITWACIGGGCLVSSPGDLGQWTEAFWADKLLPAAVRETLYTKYLRPQETDWGGTMIATAEANDFGFTASSIEFPNSHSYIFVCSNSGRAEAPNIARLIAGGLFEKTDQ